MMTCRNLLEKLENNPPLDGYLSVEHGFMPPTLPLNQLSETYSIWDQTVALIPELYFSNRTQAVLQQMPLLSATALTDEELPRAALVLSLLAHAYWRHGSDRAFSLRMSEIDGDLPNCILSPWQAVNERLGRGKRPFQSFYDLFFNNFALRSAPDAQGTYNHNDVRIENLELLIPCFKNQAERVFCMSFVEMHAVASPLVGAVVTIEEAITQNNAQSPQQIVEALATIETIIKKCLKALRKISPVPGNKNYCDPILWSKTLAIFGVPAPNYVSGATSGVFAPLVIILDALLNREKYDSEYGQYVMQERERLLPIHIVDFARATVQIDLLGFIKSQANSPHYEALAIAYNKVIDIYAGPQGFLGKHMSKVFNYLGVGTMVGRNQSTSGAERFVHQQTWIKVSKELDKSRLERIETKIKKVGPESVPTTLRMPDNLPTYTHFDLVQHHTPEDYWVVIDGYVYDLTDYLKIHPGGQEIMLAYASQDVSAYFHSIPEHTRPRMVKMLRRYLVGKYQVEPHTNQAQTAWQLLLEKLIFIRAIVDVQYTHEVEKRLGILFAGQTHTHFVQEHLATIMAAIPQGAVERNELMQMEAWQRLKQMSFVTDEDLRLLFPAEKLAHWQRTAVWFAQEDMQLLDSLIAFVLAVLAEASYADPMQAQACAELVAEWLNNHLRMIEHIAQHVTGLFRTKARCAEEAQIGSTSGCPMARKGAVAVVG